MPLTTLKMQIKLSLMFLNDQSPLSFPYAPGNGSMLRILDLKKKLIKPVKNVLYSNKRPLFARVLTSKGGKIMPC